jgi:RHS repeat-associated protein
LTFEGLNPATIGTGNTNTALVDDVQLNGVQVTNGGFETPSVQNYQIAPTGSSWSYSGSSGIAANGGTMTSGNPPAPEGNQVAFIQNDGSLWQTSTVAAGTYTLSFKAAQRSGNETYQQLRVNLRPSPGPTSVKTFVWSGNSIAEERDSTGANVTKRFFAEGEQRIGGTDSGKYYYTRDHLGSVREVSDASGLLKGQYDYDAWGNSVVIKGKMQVNFGYTGHYFHQPSGLNLAMYRGYSPALGRWISRDPIGEAGGLNVYAYVFNNAISYADPLALDVYVGEHWVVPGLNHTAIVLRPNNPSDFVGNDLFKGGNQATLSGQPSWVPNANSLYGNLVTSRNYPGDNPGTDCEKGKLKNLTLVPTPPGMTDTEFINAVIDAANSYQNNLPYAPITSEGWWWYNSNSYTSGVLRAAGATPPSLPGLQPGYNYPIPLP